jgi:hypothetical protein
VLYKKFFAGYDGHHIEESAGAMAVVAPAVRGSLRTIR